MAALDYAALELAIVKVLTADARLAGVTVSNDENDPTADVMPAIFVQVRGFRRQPLQLTGSLASGGPYLETVSIAFDCWQVSVQGQADARQQTFALVDGLLAVLQDNPQVGGVLLAQALTGSVKVQAQGSGIYGYMLVEMEAQKLTP